MVYIKYITLVNILKKLAKETWIPSISPPRETYILNQPVSQSSHKFR